MVARRCAPLTGWVIQPVLRVQRRRPQWRRPRRGRGLVLVAFERRHWHELGRVSTHCLWVASASVQRHVRSSQSIQIVSKFANPCFSCHTSITLETLRGWAALFINCGGLTRCIRAVYNNHLCLSMSPAVAGRKCYRYALGVALRRSLSVATVHLLWPLAQYVVPLLVTPRRCYISAF